MKGRYLFPFIKDFIGFLSEKNIKNKNKSEMIDMSSNEFQQRKKDQVNRMDNGITDNNFVVNIPSMNNTNDSSNDLVLDSKNKIDENLIHTDTKNEDLLNWSQEIEDHNNNQHLDKFSEEIINEWLQAEINFLKEKINSFIEKPGVELETQIQDLINSLKLKQENSDLKAEIIEIKEKFKQLQLNFRKNHELDSNYLKKVKYKNQQLKIKVDHLENQNTQLLNLTKNYRVERKREACKMLQKKINWHFSFFHSEPHPKIQQFEELEQRIRTSNENEDVNVIVDKWIREKSGFSFNPVPKIHKGKNLSRLKLLAIKEGVCKDEWDSTITNRDSLQRDENGRLIKVIGSLQRDENGKVTKVVESKSESIRFVNKLLKP